MQGCMNNLYITIPCRQGDTMTADEKMQLFAAKAS